MFNRKLKQHIKELELRVTELEGREMLRELYELPPEVQLQQLKAMVDKKLEEVSNVRNS